VRRATRHKPAKYTGTGRGKHHKTVRGEKQTKKKRKIRGKVNEQTAGSGRKPWKMWRTEKPGKAGRAVKWEVRSH